MRWLYRLSGVFFFCCACAEVAQAHDPRLTAGVALGFLVMGALDFAIASHDFHEAGKR